MSHDGPTPGMNHVPVPPAIGEGTPAAPPPPPYVSAPPPPPYVPAPPPPVYLSGQQPPEPLYTFGSPPPPAYSPPARRPKGQLPAIIAIVSAIVIAIVVLFVAVASLLSSLGQNDSAPAPAPVPVEPSEPSASSEPGEPSASSEPSEPDPNDTPVDGSVESQLQGLLDRYKTARTDGSLWEQIPNTGFNQTAVSAFLYIITDMKIALTWGGDSEGYREEAAELERRLLNEEPLGTDISIKLSDRTFTYDGTTGAGGYTDN